MRSPTVDDARALGKRLGVTHVVIVAVDVKDGSLSYASYGATRELCGEAKKLGDRLFEETCDHFTERQP